MTRLNHIDVKISFGHAFPEEMVEGMRDEIQGKIDLLKSLGLELPEELRDQLKDFEIPICEHFTIGGRGDIKDGVCLTEDLDLHRQAVHAAVDDIFDALGQALQDPEFIESLNLEEEVPESNEGVGDPDAIMDLLNGVFSNEDD